MKKKKYKFTKQPNDPMLERIKRFHDLESVWKYN